MTEKERKPFTAEEIKILKLGIILVGDKYWPELSKKMLDVLYEKVDLLFDERK